MLCEIVASRGCQGSALWSPRSRPPSKRNGRCSHMMMIRITVVIVMIVIIVPIVIITQEMGGAPRNPAPGNHFLMRSVKPSGCHCVGAFGGKKVSRSADPP